MVLPKIIYLNLNNQLIKLIKIGVQNFYAQEERIGVYEDENKKRFLFYEHWFKFEDYWSTDSNLKKIKIYPFNNIKS